MKKYSKVKDAFSKITSKLFLGKSEAAHERRRIVSKGITHIICAYTGGKVMFRKSFEYLLLKLDEDGNIYDHIENVEKFMNETLKYDDNKILIIW